MPMVRSMCHGGICRDPTRAAIDFAHGRTSSYVASDIGAMLSGRWHDSHLSRKIGAMSFVKVTAGAGNPAVGTSSAPSANRTVRLHMSGSFQERQAKGLSGPYAMRVPHPRCERLFGARSSHQPRAGFFASSGSYSARTYGRTLSD